MNRLLWGFFQISSTFSFLLKSFCTESLSLPFLLSFLLSHSFSHFFRTGIKWPKIKLHPECSGKLWKSFYLSKFHSKFSFLSHFPTCSLPNMLTKTTYFVFADFFTIFKIYDFFYALPFHMLFPLLSSLFPFSIWPMLFTIKKPAEMLPPMLRHRWTL